MRTRFARVGLLVYLVVLLAVLLNPSAALPTTSVSWLADLATRAGLPAQVTAAERIEFLANALIMVPVSLLGAVAWPGSNWRDWTAFGFVLSGAVEVVQALALALAGRSATFVDVVANTMGAFLGAVAIASVRGARRTGAENLQ